MYIFLVATTKVNCMQIVRYENSTTKLKVYVLFVHKIHFVNNIHRSYLMRCLFRFSDGATNSVAFPRNFPLNVITFWMCAVHQFRPHTKRPSENCLHEANAITTLTLHGEFTKMRCCFRQTRVMSQLVLLNRALVRYWKEVEKIASTKYCTVFAPILILKWINTH